MQIFKGTKPFLLSALLVPSQELTYSAKVGQTRVSVVPHSWATVHGLTPLSSLTVSSLVQTLTEPLSLCAAWPHLDMLLWKSSLD